MCAVIEVARTLEYVGYTGNQDVDTNTCVGNFKVVEVSDVSCTFCTSAGQGVS